MTYAEILADMDMTLGTAKPADVRLAYRLADDGGTIQAGDALRIFSEPERHTTIDLKRALRWLGCKDA